MKFRMALPVFIGDYIGTIEEYIGGDGTYVENGKIYAANIGYLNFNRERVATINSKIPRLKTGDVIFGEIVSTTKDSAFVAIERIVGIKVPVNLLGRIFIADVSDRYVKSIDEAFGIGDIVKAKVSMIEGNLIDLSTKGNLGVVTAFCRNCRHILKYDKERNILKCENCGKEHLRKISSDYRNCGDILL